MKSVINQMYRTGNAHPSDFAFLGNDLAYRPTDTMIRTRQSAAPTHERCTKEQLSSPTPRPNLENKCQGICHHRKLQVLRTLPLLHEPIGYPRPHKLATPASSFCRTDNMSITEKGQHRATVKTEWSQNEVDSIPCAWAKLGSVILQHTDDATIPPWTKGYHNYEMSVRGA